MIIIYIIHPYIYFCHQLQYPCSHNFLHLLYFVANTCDFINAKRFNTQKGFGFIVPDDGTPDVFVHQTNINTEGFRSLADGEKVEFQTETDSSGRSKAINVTGPDGTEVQGAPFREAY